MSSLLSVSVFFFVTLIFVIVFNSQKKKKDNRSEKLHDSVEVFGENIDKEINSLERDIEEFEL